MINKLKQEKEKLESKYKIKAEIERKNFDLTSKKIHLKEQQRSQTYKDIAKTSLELVGQGFRQLLTDRSMLYKLVFGVTAGYIVGYWCKSAIQLGFKLINNRFLTPRLVRETSRLSLLQSYKYPFLKYFKYSMSKTPIFEGIVLKQELKNQLSIIVNTLKQKRKHFAPFRNLLFYGPPGTGKTLFAKHLAYQSGMDFAIMTGADIAPLGRNAVDEIHKLFDWAQLSKNG